MTVNTKTDFGLSLHRRALLTLSVSTCWTGVCGADLSKNFEEAEDMGVFSPSPNGLVKSVAQPSGALIGHTPCNILVSGFEIAIDA